MELTYSELKKRDVVNIADGRCFGRVIDLKIKFPQGVLTGIFVPGSKRRGFFAKFDKTKIFIEENKIIKIGGDVILVEVRCADPYGKPPPEKPHKPPKPLPPHNPCESPCSNGNGLSREQFGEMFSDRLSDEDY
ncbi:MAG: YlmC/YmxH family sporulation protein [Clostridiales bacterium]|nr:YlmC/YmxH family sporulation protein [Clostridiales bacterium]